MKKQSLKVLSIMLVAVIGLTACDGLGKLVKNAGSITYKVTPKTLEAHGDSVVITIDGTYPAKVFPKKATVTVTPVVVYDGGEVAFKDEVLIGEAVEGDETKISNASGGSFSYTSNKVAYVPGMKVATLELRAKGQVKSKIKELPAKKIADGTIATSYLVKSDDKALIGEDKFQKIIPRHYTSNIFFAINKSTVRSSEIKGEEFIGFKTFVLEAIYKGSDFKGMNISAYASPDGELTLNEGLAEDRAKAAANAMMKFFKSKKVDSAAAAEFYTTVTTAEDWAGFKEAMEASSIADKDLILRVLTMYPDGETREKEIKNLSETYEEVKESILPKLRRAVLTLNIEEKSRTDEQITALVASHPDSLSVEEILYAATLVDEINAKLEIYKKAATVYPKDWRTANNMGYIYLMQNKMEDAEAAFTKADGLKPGNPIVKNNLGIVARRNGDRNLALELFAEAASAGDAVAYNVGIVHIQNGSYAEAVESFGDNNSLNSALAKLLSGDNDGAMAAISESDEAETALGLYLKAIVNARKNSPAEVISNLKAAIEKDGSYKEMAASDAEFLALKANNEFTSLVN